MVKSAPSVECRAGAAYLGEMSNSTNPLKTIWRALPFTGEGGPLVTVLSLDGVIGGAEPGRRGLTLRRLEKSIEAAFKPADLAAVALAVNSPGGSPVQSRLIHDAIRRKAAEKGVPVLTFIEDVGASGGYILSLAGDEIYADESSVVGSIGVIAAGFGMHEAIAKLGVERRIQTAGENKSMLDPFQPETEKDKARLQTILDELHEQFIALVKERREGKLADDAEIFSGAFWTGAKAKEKGLIDGTAQLGAFLRARYGKHVNVKRIMPDSGSLLKRLLSGGEAAAVAGHYSSGQSSGAALIDAEAALDAAERRAMWSRYGL